MSSQQPIHPSREEINLSIDAWQQMRSSHQRETGPNVAYREAIRGAKFETLMAYLWHVRCENIAVREMHRRLDSGEFTFQELSNALTDFVSSFGYQSGNRQFKKMGEKITDFLVRLAPTLEPREVGEFLKKHLGTIVYDRSPILWEFEKARPDWKDCITLK